jgi:hypothetical protein
MALSIQTVAYGAVAVVAVVLFAIGRPADRARERAAATSQVSQSAPAAPATPAPSVASGNGVTLRSVNVAFPISDRGFPGGAAAEAITDNCTACHSPGMVLNQTALTRVQWAAEVAHMRRDFKAPVAETDVAAIVNYLAATKGVK